MVLLNDLEPMRENLGGNCEEKLMKYFSYIISVKGNKEIYVVFQFFVDQHVLVFI